MAVILETSLGDITVDLFVEERPKCTYSFDYFSTISVHLVFYQSHSNIEVHILGCLNFLKLCKLKYYNFCLFHSIQVRVTFVNNYVTFLTKQLYIVVTIVRIILIVLVSTAYVLQSNLVAQTGDPTGTGRGGESVYQ